MSKILLYLILFALVLSSGCVSQGNYDELNTKYTKLQQEKASLESKNNDLNQRITALESENDRMDGQVTDLQSSVQSLEAEKTSLNSQINSLQSQVTTLQAQVPEISDAETKLDSARQKLEALKIFNTKFGEGMTLSDMVSISNSMEVVGGSVLDKWNAIMDTECDTEDCGLLMQDLQSELIDGVEADLNDASSAMDG
jgi:outer membrane murein-binding lipoprotein Lpp